ncbi:hypothetical protein TI39_contig4347g00001 [Zymoseptoria brevis]|uniref:Uncharacterized protein n=1 Tax=Zymoseptoria brevis TaxID=1047168 RepID=A0A0F4G8B8_9PEZI|nr:hypothetical protein TI39_contig4347g00001 [Zymoseptoria brevis]
MEVHKGRYFAVCCTSKNTADAANKILRAQDSRYQFMVVIRDLNETYTKISSPLVSSFDPPFEGQSVKECWQTLSAMTTRTKSDLDTEMFAILDERSSQDDSALLVLSLEGEPEIETVRVDLRNVSSILATWNSKGDNMTELWAEAEQAEDGVCRGD